MSKRILYHKNIWNFGIENGKINGIKIEQEVKEKRNIKRLEKKKRDHFPNVYRAASGESFARDSPPSSSLHLFTFLGAVIVKTPSEDRLEVMLITSWDGGKTYLRMNCRLTNPCSSCLSSCFASTITLLPTVFTVISSGENCWTSSITCGVSE